MPARVGNAGQSRKIAMIFTTRLAPGPTGFLHLGNAWAFLLAWLYARRSGGKVLLRMDDLDHLRSRPHFAAAILDDLAWLGLDWDDHIVWQSARHEFYAAALARLDSANLLYPCFCSRKDLRNLAGAPHAEDHVPAYPGICARLTDAERRQRLANGRQHSLRLRCPDASITFADLLQGPQTYAKMAYGGDFPVRRADGVWAYHLATVVDDASMDVNLVVRGRDLLSSTPGQIALYRSLGFEPPQYAHVPLLLNADGERLAKRHESLSLSTLRQNGVRATRVTGLLAFLAGFNARKRDMSAYDLLEIFEPAIIPNHDLRIGNDLLSQFCGQEV